jgi:hypothetical protein
MDEYRELRAACALVDRFVSGRAPPPSVVGSPAAPAQAQESTWSSKPPHRSLRELADGLEGVMAAKFARSGFTSPFGKLDDEPIQAFKVPAVVKERLREQANEAGLPFHEYLREICTIAAMGREAVKSAYAERVEAIAKTLKE